MIDRSLPNKPVRSWPCDTSNSLLKKMGTYMNQYTWQTTVYNGKMYVGTMDTTTLLEPLAKYTNNGDILEMTRDEWISQINTSKSC